MCARGNSAPDDEGGYAGLFWNSDRPHEATEDSGNSPALIEPTEPPVEAQESETKWLRPALPKSVGACFRRLRNCNK